MDVDYSKTHFNIYWTSASKEGVPNSFLCIWARGDKSSFINFSDIGSGNSIQDCIGDVSLPGGPLMSDVAGVGYSPSETVLLECVRRYNACGNDVRSAKQWLDADSGFGILRIEYGNRMVVEHVFSIIDDKFVPLCRRGSTPMNKVIDDWPSDVSICAGSLVILGIFGILLWKRLRAR
jgi:hypothetical protein